MTEADIIKAIDAAGEWLDISGVEGVAQGEDAGETVIEVGCSAPAEHLAARIPSTFHGFRVVLKYWGRISAQDGD